MAKTDSDKFTEGLEGCSKGCGQIGCGLIAIPILIIFLLLLFGLL